MWYSLCSVNLVKINVVYMSKKTTAKDIANVAGVTHPVVSAVLSGSTSSVKYSRKTQSRFLEYSNRLIL
jgi:hypothetical protein